ncbi:DUF2680 domain-containing protein [Bacillus sp. DJP31]|uniref:DUF2680 domain-containing protein n=1 Tax=Bacillus sp. DJP31 TaxID=3409789 RepID=UPI003BB6C01E
MKKLVSSIILIFLSLGFLLSPVQAEPTPEQNVLKVELTEKQKKEIKKLHKEMFETKKELIEKYIEYGVLSKEKGEMILKKMEDHFKEMEKNGYIPNWEGHHRHHHRE